MFHLFRSRKQTFRIVLAVIVAPVIITMVVTLIPGIGGSSSGGGGETVLAEIGDRAVTLRDAQSELQEYIRTQRLPPGAINFLAPQVLQNLISETVLLEEAERLGLGVTEAEMVELMRTSLPFLFEGGNFIGKDRYAAFVRDRFQRNIPEFEALLRKDMAMTKLRRLVTDPILLSDAEVEKEFVRRNEKAKIQWVTVGPSLVSVTSTQAEIEEHFKQNRASYMLPERRSFQYLVLDDAKIAAGITVSQQEAERYYNENRDRYRVQDRSHVTHILLKTTEKKEDEIKKIEAKAQDVLKQAKANKDWAELAKTYSEDASTANRGGEVGWITRGQTVPEFEHKAFTMKPGEISDVIRTEYGFHIVKVLERETARLKGFAEVEASIRDDLTRDRADLERGRLTERARAAALRHAQKLDEAGREAGLPVLTARLLERSHPVPEVGTEPALMEALFSASKGVVLGPIQMSSKSVIAVVTEISPTRQAELAEVIDRVRNETSAAKARVAAGERAKQLAERAKALGGDLSKTAKEFKAEVKTSDLFTREGSVAGLGSAATLGEAFAAPPGAIAGPVGLGNDQVVYKVLERHGPDSGASAEEKKVIRQTMLGTRQNEAFEIFKEDLKERLKKQGKVKIYQDRVDRFTNSNRS